MVSHIPRETRISCRTRRAISTYPGTKRMVLEREWRYWMLSFGFVSGPDFSRAVKDGKRIGASAPAMAILHEMHCASMVQNPVKSRAREGKHAPGLKPTMITLHLRRG